LSGHRVDIHSGAYHVSKHGSVGVGKWASLGSAEEESLLGVLFVACILSMVLADPKNMRTPSHTGPLSPG